MPCPSSFVRVGLFLTMIALSSCSPVKFSTDNTNTATADPGANPITPTGTSISCNPVFNGNSTSVTLTPGSSNPALAANCTPTAVSYVWTVVKNGSPVTINGLTGSSSVPDFQSAGTGTYSVYLDANAQNYTAYHLANPLTVVVQGAPPVNGTITCSPTANGSTTGVTTAGTNPVIAANCNPNAVSYVWTVQRNGVATTVTGLSGSSSTPDFIGAGTGTYQVWLSATAAGYNAYTSANPLVITVPAAAGHFVHDQFSVTAANNKIDILLVVDDSSSMLADNQRLASRLNNFVSGLSAKGLDWQMCATLTNAVRISSSDPNYYWGASYNWSGNANTPAWILKPTSGNVSAIFSNTINAIGAGWAGTDDERAIKSAWWHLWNGEPNAAGNSGCYRQDAGLAVIILSDEDERSIGGDSTQQAYASEANKPLESDDLPSTYVSFVKQVFGNAKRFTVNSIIVRPGDTTCKAAQDAEGSASHYGVNYAQLTSLTGGYAGSICDSDFSTNLNYFQSMIVNSQASFPLQCSAPTGPIAVAVNPNAAYSTHIDTSRLVFSPQVPAGSLVDLQYTCP